MSEDHAVSEIEKKVEQRSKKLKNKIRARKKN